MNPIVKAELKSCYKRQLHSRHAVKDDHHSCLCLTELSNHQIANIITDHMCSSTTTADQLGYIQHVLTWLELAGIPTIYGRP